MKYIIKVNGSWGKIEPIPEGILKETLIKNLSYEKKNSQFIPNWNWRWVKLYKDNKGEFPIGLMPLVEKIFEKLIIKYEVKRKTIVYNMKDTWYNENLRSYQKTIIKEVLANPNRCIISACVGAGKTLMSKEIIQTMNEKTLITVPTVEIKKQWIKELNGITDVEITTYQKVMAMLKKDRKKAIEWLKSFKLYISDECLVGGSKIITDQGFISISNIVKEKYGGKVLSYNLEKNRLEYKKILNYYEKEPSDVYRIILENEKGKRIKITATPNHKLFYNGSYKRIDKLKIGDILLCYEKSICPICYKEFTRNGLAAHLFHHKLNKSSQLKNEYIKKLKKGMDKADKTFYKTKEFSNKMRKNKLGQKNPMSNTNRRKIWTKKRELLWRKKIKEWQLKNPSFVKVGNGRGMSALEIYFYHKFLNNTWKYNKVFVSKSLKNNTLIRNLASHYKIDFYNEVYNTAIEIDGYNIHKNRRDIDLKKSIIFIDNKIKILRFNEKDIYYNEKFVRNVINYVSKI